MNGLLQVMENIPLCRAACLLTRLRSAAPTLPQDVLPLLRALCSLRWQPALTAAFARMAEAQQEPPRLLSGLFAAPPEAESLAIQQAAAQQAAALLQQRAAGAARSKKAAGQQGECVGRAGGPLLGLSQGGGPPAVYPVCSRGLCYWPHRTATNLTCRCCWPAPSGCRRARPAAAGPLPGGAVPPQPWRARGGGAVRPGVHQAGAVGTRERPVRCEAQLTGVHRCCPTVNRW